MRLTIVAVAVIFATGCQRKPQTEAVPPLPKVEVAEVRAPAAPSVVVQSGETLRSVAAAAYGHEDFSGFVGQFNRVTAPERLMAGATLQTPSLPIALREAGLDPHYQPAINALARAWDDLQSTLPSYIAARNASGLRDGQSFPIAAELRGKMVGCADVIDAALDVLNHPSAGHKAPHRTIGQFAGTSNSLRRLSTGFIESRDYDTFMLQKGMGLGFTYALIWAQEHHQ